MALQLETLDGRHSGNIFFKYRVWVYGPDRIRDFINVRNWCWEVWGSSCEREDYMMSYSDQDVVTNSQWAWHKVDRSRYIYLVNDQALAFFKLKWL